MLWFGWRSCANGVEEANSGVAQGRRDGYPTRFLSLGAHLSHLFSQTFSGDMTSHGPPELGVNAPREPALWSGPVLSPKAGLGQPRGGRAADRRPGVKGICQLLSRRPNHRYAPEYSNRSRRPNSGLWIPAFAPLAGIYEFILAEAEPLLVGSGLRG